MLISLKRVAAGMDIAEASIEFKLDGLSCHTEDELAKAPSLFSQPSCS